MTDIAHFKRAVWFPWFVMPKPNNWNDQVKLNLFFIQLNKNWDTSSKFSLLFLITKKLKYILLKAFWCKSLSFSCQILQKEEQGIFPKWFCWNATSKGCFCKPIHNSHFRHKFWTKARVLGKRNMCLLYLQVVKTPVSLALCKSSLTATRYTVYSVPDCKFLRRYLVAEGPTL